VLRVRPSQRLFFDVEGAGLVADGPTMRTKPTLILLHGGPGFDHTTFKPAFSALADIAQIIYFDHRGNGRSTGNDPKSWNLTQWGDDVKGLCDAFGIEKPIVYGLSFGGFVAQSYATRHPDHPAKLVLASTAARIDFDEVFAAFERIGGVQPIGCCLDLNQANTRGWQLRQIVPFVSSTPVSARTEVVA
jgi:pimeloyl-ACP methyl ester carboxylesterase